MAVERFPVEYGHIVMFARAVGDPNPVYHDEEQAAKSEAGGIIAPPTFVAGGAQFDADYGLRPKPGQPWFGSGKEPSGARREGGGGGAAGGSGGPAQRSGAAARSAAAPRQGGTGLHAEQHYTYHRHLRPGDVLRAVSKPGETWEKEGRRAGKLVFRESITEYYDANDELVITARSVGVRTEKVVEG